MPSREHLDYNDIFNDLLKIAAVTPADLEVGEEVLAYQGGGRSIRGPVQAMDPDGVTVRGKRYPFSAIQTADEVEDRARQNRQKEQEAILQAEREAAPHDGRGPGKPLQRPIDFSSSPALPVLRGLSVDVRLYWQDHYDAIAREWAAENGVPVDGCTANKFGEHGGKVPQWGICGRVAVSTPEDLPILNLLVQELSAGGGEPGIIERRIVVNGYAVAAGLAKCRIPGTQLGSSLRYLPSCSATTAQRASWPTATLRQSTTLS